MTRDEAISILDDLDNMDRSVSDWEADFIDSLLTKAVYINWTPTTKQATTIQRMKEKYL